MQYSQFTRAAVGMVALILFISTATVVDARTDPFSRVQDRLEEARERVNERLDAARDRLEERQNALCERFESRGIPASPIFCDGVDPEPEPTLTFEADPTTIDEGDSSELSWESDNADSCTASGGWSGDKALDGTQSVSPTTDTTYILTCEGEGGEIERSVTVFVDEDDDEPAPTLEFSADPEDITEGGTSTLTWDADNADSCTASDGWSGDKAVSGSQVVSPIATTTYTLTCEGDGGEVEKSVTIGVTPEDETPLPTVEISANPMTIDEGGTSTLSWESEDADICIASNGWSGEKALSGTQVVSPIATTTYTIACGNETGTTTDSVVVGVDTEDAEPLPTVNLTATPMMVDEGGTSTLSWETEDAELCVASGGWSGTRALSGSVVVAPTGTTTYVLDCSNDTGTTTDSVTIAVVLDDEEPVANILITEVYYDVDSDESESANEWVELYNAGDETVVLTDWYLRDAGGFTDMLPTISMDAGEVVIITNATSTGDFFTIPGGTQVIYLGSPIGNGLGNTGDAVELLNSDDVVVDAVSWGASIVAFDPAVGGVSEGESIERCPADVDTDTAADWVERVTPTPGETPADCDDELPLPTVMLSADPMTIVEGGTSTLAWETDDADLCIATNGWTGEKALSGTEIVMPIATTTYTLECGNETGTTSDSVIVGVTAQPSEPLPTVDLSATPMTIALGASSTLTWETTDADFCVGRDGWSGVVATSGSTMVSPTTTTMYTLDCGNEVGTTTDSVTVTVAIESSYDGMVLSEVYYDTDAEHGTDADHEWIEIYNGTGSEVDFAGWLEDASGSQDMIATTTIPALGYLVIADATTTADYWDIPEGAVVIFLESNIGNGLGNAGDALYLYAWDGTLLDALSWGSDTSVFDPSAPDVADGNSLARDPVTTDTDTAADWSEQSTPTPGGAVAEAPFEQADSIVISEVYFDVDDAHGAEGANEWIEIYNPTATSVDLIDWQIGAGTSSTQVISTSSLVLAPGEYIIVAADTATATATYWDFSDASAVISLGALITSSGLANGGDEVRLYDATLNEIDAVSYGTNTNVFDPAPDASEGQSLSRDPRDNDTDGGSDWVAESTPNPGT